MNFWSFFPVKYSKATAAISSTIGNGLLSLCLPKESLPDNEDLNE
ncbi:MAG: hypothetical protein RCG15_01595 [Candidatus Rickettsia vulgarisii]